MLQKTKQMQSFPSIFKHQTFTSLLKPKTSPNLFTRILSQSLTSGLFFNDPFISSKLLHFALFNSPVSLDFARALFSQIPNPNVHSWNFLLRAYSHSSSPHEAINLFNRMRRENVEQDNHTFPFVIKACGRVLGLDIGKEVHCLSLVCGLESDVFVQNALITMYFEFGFDEFAHKVFDLMPYRLRDVVSWNSLISGYLQCGFCDRALELLRGMLRDGTVRLNDVTVATALTLCARMRMLELGRQIHGWVRINNLVLDVFIGSSLIDMYSKCGLLDEARRIFDRLTQKNVVCWTSMISCYAQLDMFKEAMELFREMQMDGVKAEPATVACMLSACGHAGALDQGRWMQRYCERNGIEMELIVKNALVDMYSKCGDIEKALEIFIRMTDKDTFSWSTIISALAMNGRANEALEMFSQMERSSNVLPNEVTFLGVLSACSHGGFVDEGFYYLDNMTKHYEILPKLEHYGCMVDLLGRANLLVEAKRFIEAMPVHPDAVIWRSLLFACRNHGNLEMAEFAASNIEELDAEKSGELVLLSNMYASSSRWSDMKKIRRNMADQGIQKQPGCSFVEINGAVHEFFVADSVHHESDLIYDVIRGFHRILRSIKSDLLFLDLDNFHEDTSGTYQDMNFSSSPESVFILGKPPG